MIKREDRSAIARDCQRIV